MSQQSPVFRDLSESSFQIPLGDTSDLLANDDDDFFHGADHSLSTPIPQSTAHEPLTLSQLTPKLQHRRTQTVNTFPAPAEHLKVPKGEPMSHIVGGSSGKLTPKLKVSTVPSFENLKEVDTFLSDSQPVKPLLPTRERANSTRKCTVAAGGISKIPPKSELTRGVIQASFSRPTEAILHDAEIDALPSSPDRSYANTSAGSIASHGVAERLLVYSQKFMPTHTSLFDCDQPSVSELPWQDSSSPDPPSSSHADAPLTLSQVSPRKPSPMNAGNGRNPTPASPTRPSTKRPLSRTTTSSHQSKRGKGMSVPAPVLQPSIRKNTSTAVRPKALKPKPGTSRRAERGQGTERGITHSAGSGSQEAHCRQAEVPTEVKLDKEAISDASQTAGLMPRFRTTHTTLRPFGFDFQLASRQVDSRKVDSEDKNVSRKAPHPLSVPDFKALHATQEAQVALRKEQITPIYPLRIELNTESRAKEREKFDELMREKERETERALEQRKKEKEAEEEREIKEMRKKAVPKAHEVPGWYKEAPRRERLDVVG